MNAELQRAAGLSEEFLTEAQSSKDNILKKRLN
jgi:hypothetical protein